MAKPTIDLAILSALFSEARSFFPRGQVCFVKDKVFHGLSCISHWQKKTDVRIPCVYILPFYDISHLWTCLLMLPRSKTIFTLLFEDFGGCYGGLLLFVYYYLVFVAFYCFFSRWLVLDLLVCCFLGIDMFVSNVLGVLILWFLVDLKFVAALFHSNFTGDIIPVVYSSYGVARFRLLGHNHLIWGFGFGNSWFYRSVSIVVVVSFWYNYLYFLVQFVNEF